LELEIEIEVDIGDYIVDMDYIVDNFEGHFDKEDNCYYYREY